MEKHFVTRLGRAIRCGSAGRRLSSLCLAALLATAGAAWAGPVKNGFDLAGSAIPVEQILAGGPPRDGIPAIDRPRFVAAAEAGRLRPDDRVLGLVLRGEVRAYPVAIMNWHEIVNDRIGGQAVVVTYCPLCGSGIAYRAEFGGRSYRFGVSGLLYNSDVLLYDRQTESLWSQLMNRAVSGPMRGRELEMLPLEHTSWADWRARHPATEVLSFETGYRRDYGRDPYRTYRQQAGTMFPLSHSDRRYDDKTWVLGVRIGREAVVYPFPELQRSPGHRLQDQVGGKALTIVYDPAHGTARATDADGRIVPSVSAYWFAWMAFHPDSRVYRATGTDR